ncbi:hypothetical protein MASR2M66_13460 [Chloroflexota bacterium]
MSASEYKARQVRAKTHEVYEYDHNEDKPGKPLHILIPGGLIALSVLAVIIFVGYLTFVEKRLDQNLGLILMGILAPFYVGGVFLFSYGYELYNIPRAIRLTAIIVFVTLTAVVIVAVLALALGSSKGGGFKSSSDRSSKSAKSSNSSSSSSKGALGGMVLGGMAKKSSSGSSSSGGNFGSGPIFIGGLGGTRVETREVTKEVVKEVPKEPQPIACPFCARSYVPAENNFVCPSCGASTPTNLIEESQLPKE